VPEIWEAFQLDPESFQSKYGFYKPDSNDGLIIHCRSGIRARTAADKLALLNYDKVQVYKGSFLDWESRGGEIQTEQ
jgi:rhodanese-related sulfurtransferase